MGGCRETLELSLAALTWLIPDLCVPLLGSPPPEEPSQTAVRILSRGPGLQSQSAGTGLQTWAISLPFPWGLRDGSEGCPRREQERRLVFYHDEKSLIWCDCKKILSRQ